MSPTRSSLFERANGADLEAFLKGSQAVAAALVTPDGLVIEANVAFQQLGGRVSSVREVVAAGQARIVMDLIASAGSSWRSVTAGLVRTRGELVDCQLWAVAQGEDVLLLAERMQTSADKLSDLLLELNDDLVLARRALASQNRRLRELDELKDLFLASVTHDLKQPLTSILGYTEILQDQQPDPDTRQAALVIDRNARRALAMMNDLLDAASITTGDLQLELAQVDIVTLVRVALDAIHPAAESGAVTMTRVGAESATALVDEQRVMQLLDNLLSNAVKYSPDGGRVTIHCGVQDDHVVVSVTDTGMGIPPADRHRVFDRYFRAATAVGRGIEGTGLGLANARAFAEAHGGTLTCTSELGVGSTFTLSLPVAPSPGGRVATS